jgi:hypothetical protein
MLKQKTGTEMRFQATGKGADVPKTCGGLSSVMVDLSSQPSSHVAPIRKTLLCRTRKDLNLVLTAPRTLLVTPPLRISVDTCQLPSRMFQTFDSQIVSNINGD